MYRKEVGFGAIVIDEDKQILDYVQSRVSSQDTDYSETLEKVRTSFINLGGILIDH